MAEQLARAYAHSAKFVGRAYAETSDHPLQRKLTFIFTDYAPNGNNQGVPQSEADNVAKSALYMPVKINFDGEGPGGHKGAEPIGPIVKMIPSAANIVGEAIIWKDEFPDIDTYLQSASAEDGGVQFSWELYFEESDLDPAGVEWLHGITTAGIAIVDNPAYQGRTPLIAIAEGTTMDLEELKAQVSELTNKLYSMLDALYAALALPGAVDKSSGIEEQFTSVIEAIKGFASTATELESAKSTLETVTTELTALREFKQSVEATAQKQSVLGTRREQLEAAGVKFSDESFSERADRIYEMSDDVFAFYVSDLAAVSASPVAKSDKTSASKLDVVIPDPATKPEVTKYDIKDLAHAFRSAKAMEMK